MSLSFSILELLYTEQTGLPFFDRAALIKIRSWCCSSALESMGGKQTFRCRFVDIGLKYKH